MRSSTSSSSARRDRRLSERRTRRRPAIVAAGLAFGLVAAAGLAVTATASEPSASGTSATFALASYSARTAPMSTLTTVDKTASATEVALTNAETSIAAAATVTADIQASGLDIGTPQITVDTTELATAAAKLEGAKDLPEPLLPDLTDDVTTLTASVDGAVTGLRSSLDAAQAAKAAADAAAEAQRAAEAAAATAAAAKPAASSSTPRPSYAAGGTSAGEAQAIARSMIAGYGWGDDQFSCLVSLWNRESGWNVYASNPSGAYGIPQALPGSKMASAGADWQTSASTQISWGLGYITGRYGTACGAWSHSESNGWY
ncbi:16S rRNA pseudouridylate synthase [Microbacterium sp. Root61]|uniref:aggregation-promoting factor C-terminal-like domain-containing protein n=1 Tax=Microbacterium sp. Root61 TaxID=1736570 RepID=UPI0006F46D74|nr:hypothetical protein [Microbacterium sp. Root61]KRA23616.1 16S rRNA pseudouridylate synthase [Microbacterium sp. Root61]